MSAGDTHAIIKQRAAPPRESASTCTHSLCAWVVQQVAEGTWFSRCASETLGESMDCAVRLQGNLAHLCEQMVPVWHMPRTRRQARNHLCSKASIE